MVRVTQATSINSSPLIISDPPTRSPSCVGFVRWKNVILYGEIKIDPATLKIREP